MQKSIGAEILKTFKENSQKVFLKSFLSQRQYTGAEAISIIQKIAISLLAEDCEEKSCVAIYAQNCPEWSMFDIACLQTRVVSVPIFATNNAVHTDYILNDAEVKLVVVGSQEQYDEILKIERHEDFRLIIFDDKVELKTDKSIYFKDWIELYDENGYKALLEGRINNIQESDLATLIYTSGTTGNPKGVQLHHRQFNAMLANHNAVYDLKPEYTSIAFLPLSHVYERGWTYIVLANGMTNIYLSNPKVVAKAIESVKPDTFCAVPRLYEKIHGKILDEISQGATIKQKIFHWALKQGKRRLSYVQNKKTVPSLLSLKYQIADALVFSKIKAKLGGNLKICPCGGAYIADELVEFFRALGVPLLVGYGLTESTATVTSFTEENFKVGSVGKPIVNVEVKIGENNEILVKGDTITSGYYKLEEETREQFTADGWFKTGDAGHLDEKGFLFITDRIKQLIKTANGKYIAPQLVEGHLTQSRFIAQAMIIGEGKSYVSALFTLDQEYVEEWAKNNHIKYDNLEDLAQNKTLINAISNAIDKEQAELSSYEKVKRFKVLPYEFTMENDELTPTLKLKRKIIEERYADIISSFYK